MTNTMRDRFEEWCVDNDREATRFPDGNYSIQPFSSGDAWDCYRTAHADMLPVLERVREVILANQRNVYMSAFEWESCETVLTELEAIMKGESDAPKRESVSFVDVLAEAKKIVEASPLFKKFIDGTPLQNDIAVWMAEFAIRKAKGDA